MTNITPEELRSRAKFYDAESMTWTSSFIREAADTIERLAKHVERLRMALADCRTTMPCSPWLTDIRLGVINQVVDAALTEQPDA